MVIVVINNISFVMNLVQSNSSVPLLFINLYGSRILFVIGPLICKNTLYIYSHQTIRDY